MNCTDRDSLIGVAVRLWKSSLKITNSIQRHKTQEAIEGNFADVNWKPYLVDRRGKAKPGCMNTKQK